MDYEPPEWSEPTSKAGHLEILKSGAVFTTIPITIGSKSISFGRLPENTVPMDHESISRKHAVIQFGPGNSAFLFDLNSTHGTCLNKKQIPSGQFIKITSENDLIQFGGSSRMFILHLEPVEVKPEVSLKESASSITSDPRGAILNFFAEHGIDQRDIQTINNEGVIACSLDYGEYVSVGSEAGSSVITSSGSSKREALANFFEDSLNFLLRLGLISQQRQEDDSDEEDGTDFDDEKPVKAKSKDTALSQQDILNLRSGLQNQLSEIEARLDKISDQLKELDAEVVEDFDVYILQIKKDQLLEDFDRVSAEKPPIIKEIEKYDSILNLIGYKAEDAKLSFEELDDTKRRFEELEDEQSAKATEAPVQAPIITDVPQPKALPSKMPSAKLSTIAPAKKIKPSTPVVQDNSELEDYQQFEDATDPSDLDNVQNLKDKFGY